MIARSRVAAGSVLAVAAWSVVAVAPAFAAVSAEQLTDALEIELWTKQLVEKTPLSEILPTLEQALLKDDFKNPRRRLVAYKLLVYGNDVSTWGQDKNTFSDGKTVTLLIRGLHSDQNDVAELCAKALGRASGDQTAVALKALTDLEKMNSISAMSVAAEAANKLKKDSVTSESILKGVASFVLRANGQQALDALDTLCQQGVSLPSAVSAATAILKMDEAAILKKYTVPSKRAFAMPFPIDVRHRAAWYLWIVQATDALLAMRPSLDQQGKDAVALACEQAVCIFPIETLARSTPAQWAKLVDTAFEFIEKQPDPFRAKELPGFILISMLLMDPAPEIPLVRERLLKNATTWAGKDTLKGPAKMYTNAQVLFDAMYKGIPEYHQARKELFGVLKGVKYTQWSQSALQLKLNSYKTWRETVELEKPVEEKILGLLQKIDQMDESPAMNKIRDEHPLFEEKK